MIRIILSGCHGKMGHVVSGIISEREDCKIVAGFDIDSGIKETFPVMSEPDQFDGNADVIIDFSHPSFLPKLLSFAKEKKIPAVIATTGMNDAQIEMIKEASNEVPIFFSANMSLGVNLILSLAKKATALLSPDFDIEIVEKHHNQKVDAPSGTALMIADSISSVLSQKPEYVFDRHSDRKKRTKNEIGIHSIRGGTIVGEHDIIFAGKDELIEIKHTAMSKQIFAVGAVNAAVFLTKSTTGLYNMGDLVASIGG
ncbi:MAG TPA: 4-hydroxy-tetrahydrodipicolinate reductase [Ruminiclostridium sp.]|nr:4-hydroxy-tetrahydrodipicolinate reductase [Ruminiclostridium sp.]